MIRIVVAVRDRALDAFGTPFFVVAVGQAIRSFGDEVNRKGSDLCAHPDDFDLYELGSFDDATGQLQSLGDPRQIAIGENLVVNGGSNV